MLNSLFIALILLYTLDILALLYYAVHLYALALLFLKNKNNCKTDESALKRGVEKMKHWPKVTVQLPVFNEYYVVERLIDSVVKLDYPKNRLEIQVLDDSTDESRFLAEKKVAEYKKLGFDIVHIHRTDRTGHKAGALKAGLEKSKGEFVAIFDADFLPPEDFLKKTVPHFYLSERLGMIQTRWGHINAEHSLLTRAQSIGIDGHFIIEHTARNGSGLWMNFNGTAGIWRKECILDAGNWHNDTLTEDLDLSYRALLNNWKFLYLWDIVSPAELPPTISAFKSQQFRWAKGSIQTAIKLLPKIAKANIPLKIKVEAFTHMLGYTVHPLMVLNILLILPVIAFRSQNEFLAGGLLFNAAIIMALSTLAPMIFYTISQQALYPDWRKRIRRLPVLTMIGTGIAINNTRAWMEAVLGKKSSFVRTPKLKIESSSDSVSERSRYNDFKIGIITWLEIFLGLYLVVTIGFALSAGVWMISPFLLIYASGFFYVAGLAILDSMKSARRAGKAKTGSAATSSV